MSLRTLQVLKTVANKGQSYNDVIDEILVQMTFMNKEGDINPDIIKDIERRIELGIDPLSKKALWSKQVRRDMEKEGKIQKRLNV